jgi:putative ABC transport system permease protein
MVEGVTLAVGGIVVGLAIGIPIAQILVDLTGDQLFELTFILDVPTLLGALGVAIAAVACVSALPGLIAARLRPIQVLRYE